jgi:hypothetical protein
MSELKSLCENPDFHSLYFLENRASRVAPTKVKIEKGCGNRFLRVPTQTLKLRPPKNRRQFQKSRQGCRWYQSGWCDLWWRMNGWM